MTEPVADRPVMSEHGILPADEGSGLIAWSEAERRLTVAHRSQSSRRAPAGRPGIGL